MAEADSKVGKNLSCPCDKLSMSQKLRLDDMETEVLR